MRSALPFLRLALAALCGLTVAVALIPDAGRASSHHGGATPRQAPASTDATCTDASCTDTTPVDPCEYDDSCYDNYACTDPSCDDTTPVDGCTDAGCDGADTTPTDPNGAPGAPSAAQTIAVVLRRGYYDAGWIPLTARGSIYATLDEAATQSAHTTRASHRRHHGVRARVLAREHASLRHAGQVHLFLHLTGRGRHVLRRARGPLTLTLTMTTRLHGATATTSTATFALPLR